MRIFFSLTVFILLLSACATAPTGAGGYAYTPYPTINQLTEAEMRVEAAQAEYAAISAQSTQQSAQQTAVAQSTVETANALATTTSGQSTRTHQAQMDALTVQQTQAAITAQSTLEAIAAIGTGTAVAQVANMEAALVADEATRVAIMREEERLALQYDFVLNTYLKPAAWVIGLLAVIIVAYAFADRLWHLSRPVRNMAGETIAIPGNSFQILPGVKINNPEPERLYLPHVSDGIRPFPQMDTGHILIAGETGSGKSTAMRAVLQHRQNVVVLDPHYSPGEWGRVRVIGGGRDFEAIGEYMNYMQHELKKRYTQRVNGQSHFEPITVATDEMPAIIDAQGKQIGAIWREWLREGRKVGLYFCVSTQSTRVKTLGIDGEGDLLENFTYSLLLGKVAQAEYRDMVQGMERPAVIASVEGIHPVTIPYIPTGGQDTVEDGQWETLYEHNNRPLFTAPQPARGIHTEGGFVPQIEVDTILSLNDTGVSRRAISRQMYGNDGGTHYQKVQGVLDQLVGKVTSA